MHDTSYINNNNHTGHGPYSHMFEHKVVPAVMNGEVNITKWQLANNMHTKDHSFSRKMNSILKSQQKGQPEKM